MSLTQHISDSLKEAMKAKDQPTMTLLRALKSALKYASIEKFGPEGELDATDSIAVVRKMVKQRQDSLTSFETAGREDLAANERAELAMLEKFLPTALSADELGALVEAAVAEVGATSKAQMGAVMKLVQERAAGRADGKALSQAVMAKLG